MRRVAHHGSCPVRRTYIPVPSLVHSLSLALLDTRTCLSPPSHRPGCMEVVEVFESNCYTYIIHRVATPRQTHPSLGLHKTPVSTFAPAATRVFFLVLNQSKLCSPPVRHTISTDSAACTLHPSVFSDLSWLYSEEILSPRFSPSARGPGSASAHPPHPSFLAHQPPRSTTFNHQHHQKITPPSEKKKNDSQRHPRY